MGKAADNEKHKLRAAFYNNLATGVIITGYAVPYFAFLRKWWDRPPPESLSSLLLELTDKEIWLLSALGLWALMIAWGLRRITNRILEQIDD